jgi:phosphohistidine phosphatase
MNILLMRHCLAATVNQSGVSYDAERPLTEEGQRHASAVAEYLKRNSYVPSLILCTPFFRSSKTAEIISKYLGDVQVQPTTTIMPGAGVDDLLGAISKNATDKKWVLAVMHEPDCSYMLAKLLLKEEAYPLAVLPGDVFALSLQIEDEEAFAELVSFYSPIKAEKI